MIFRKDGGSLEKSGIVVVSRNGRNYKKIISYLDENAREGVLRVDTISEALDIIYSADAEVLIADLGKSRKKLSALRTRPFYNTTGDARKNLDYLVWYINAHCGEKLNLTVLGNMIGVTPNYLCRLFREEKGVTISRYIEQVRLKKAADELVTSERFVQDISLQFGYRNDSYFCRAFKREYGLTPAEYREKMRRQRMKREDEETADT